MTELVSPGGPLPHIPDHLTLAQFILDSTHECRPIRPQGSAWLVDDATGRKVGLEEVTIPPFDLEPLDIVEHIFMRKDSISSIRHSKCVEFKMGHWYVPSEFANSNMFLTKKIVSRGE
jgi:hypothetical protein